MIDLLDELGAERASLGGLSLGGMVAMWVAAHHRDRVERLALVCTAALLGPRQNWIDRSATVRAEGMGSVVVR